MIQTTEVIEWYLLRQSRNRLKEKTKNSDVDMLVLKMCEMQEGTYHAFWVTFICEVKIYH